jgi:putative peptidoglycan lipid II flippase
MIDAPQSLLKTNILVATGTLICRITGFLRVLTLAYVFGLTGLSDVYNTANTTPNIIYELMMGGILSATLLPIIVRAIKDDDHDAISAVLSVTGLCLWALTCLMVLASPLIMSLYSQARLDEPAIFHRTGTILVAYFLPQIFFYGIISLATAVLNARPEICSSGLCSCAQQPDRDWRFTGGWIFVSKYSDLERSQPKPRFARFTRAWNNSRHRGKQPDYGPCRSPFRSPAPFLPDWKHPALRQVLRLSGWTLGYVIANQAALFMINKTSLKQGRLAQCLSNSLYLFSATSWIVGGFDHDHFFSISR